MHINVGGGRGGGGGVRDNVCLHDRIWSPLVLWWESVFRPRGQLYSKILRWLDFCLTLTCVPEKRWNRTKTSLRAFSTKSPIFSILVQITTVKKEGMKSFPWPGEGEAMGKNNHRVYLYMSLPLGKINSPLFTVLSITDITLSELFKFFIWIGCSVNLTQIKHEQEFSAL